MGAEGTPDTDFRLEMELTNEALSPPLFPGDQDRQALPSEQSLRTLPSVWPPSSLRAGGERPGGSLAWDPLG